MTWHDRLASARLKSSRDNLSYFPAIDTSWHWKLDNLSYFPAINTSWHWKLDNSSSKSMPLDRLYSRATRHSSRFVDMFSWLYFELFSYFCKQDCVLRTFQMSVLWSIQTYLFSPIAEKSIWLQHGRCFYFNFSHFIIMFILFWPGECTLYQEVQWAKFKLKMKNDFEVNTCTRA